VLKALVRAVRIVGGLVGVIVEDLPNEIVPELDPFTVWSASEKPGAVQM